MPTFILMMLLVLSGTLCLGQNTEAKPLSPLDARVQDLEEKLNDQQFEIDQLKKALLQRDEEIRALTELIEGDPEPDDNSRPPDDTFDVGTVTCRQIRFVRFLHPRYQPGKAKGHSVGTLN